MAMKPLKKLQIANGDMPMYVLYEQAVYWESLRAHYFAQHDNLEAAMDATARAAHYQAALEAIPERGHVYIAPQMQRGWG
jgi:hypothetical protein